MGEFLDFVYENFNYKLYIPSIYHGDQELPLLVMLHGCGQNPDDFAAGTRMNELAEKEAFLVLYPDMNHHLDPREPSAYNPFGCWNWFLDKNQHRGEGHPKLIYGMILEVGRTYRIDSVRVYAAGLSAGGSMACILGVTYPDVFNGIAICSGLAYSAANVSILSDPRAEKAKKAMENGVADPYECGNRAFQEMGDFKKKMPVIVFHGTCDTTVHPINGLQVITQWAQTHFLIDGGEGHANIVPARVKSGIINGNSYTQHVYHDGDDEPRLELWTIEQLGHAWSGGSPNGSYTDPFGPNASEMIWKFFSQSQQQPNKNQMESQEAVTALTSYELRQPPISSQAEAPVQLPETEQQLSTDHPQDQITIETTAELPLDASEKLPVELTNRHHGNAGDEKTKKNFFKKLLTMLKKR
ncbi:extracellular catalytic domain type 1 short-chain-length polyhydroxyalkanoate depolymerase [Bacillus tuaregi]|uniref:extracellular catalytic domain type 1 short-chain-length polyhydroxyalkanoate depolymerase n=1 Tax=Bacillus tuaregi TaxID=1816695 RepID=UPI0008F89A26|nr:PHB depolymerase family esterase [Bacillus tuaregi]